MISQRYLEDALFHYGSLHLIQTNLICFSGQQPSLYLCHHSKLVLTCTIVAITSNECKGVPGKPLMLERCLWLEWCSWLWNSWTPVPCSVERKKKKKSSVPSNFWVLLDGKACCCNSDDFLSFLIFFFFNASLSKIATFLYQLKSKPCSTVLMLKGHHDTTDGIKGLTIKKQFLQNRSCFFEHISSLSGPIHWPDQAI